MKRQSRPRTAYIDKAGDENRSGMNPGVAGSNPAVDATISIEVVILHHKEIS
ncbi:hypothetical protein [Bartonella sp. A05]|uniref:hypothetical protein n=1 Tax=Bartonella sp. A05 TaxID=2967261 RepID=UPI0022A9C3C5|nr:hypothetical protein [Bartonella sp. A05]MCZ2203545.1 hypothetical protein [Bartonella sp. A05]